MSPRNVLSIVTGASLGVGGALWLRFEAPEPVAVAARAAPTPPLAAPASAEVEPVAFAPPTASAQVGSASADREQWERLRKADRTPRPVSTPKELLRAEMACDAKNAEGCARAAVAYEEGIVVSQNLSRAHNYRKRELTLIVRRCDARSPAGCLELARRYAEGDGIELSQEKADALVAHAGEICRLKYSRECDVLEKKK
jgi:TPR repeat protein